MPERAPRVLPSLLGYAAVFGLRSRGLDQPWIVLPLAAVVGAAGFLIYARLLGRTALITSQVSAKHRKERIPERPSTAERARSFDPWSVPDENPPRPKEPRSPRAQQHRKNFPSKKKPSGRTSADPYGPAEGSYEVMPHDVPIAPSPSPSRHSACAITGESACSTHSAAAWHRSGRS